MKMEHLTKADVAALLVEHPTCATDNVMFDRGLKVDGYYFTMNGPTYSMTCTVARRVYEYYSRYMQPINEYASGSTVATLRTKLAVAQRGAKIAVLLAD